MRIPKSVTICGMVFTIHYKTKIVYNEEECLGLCAFEECKIYILKSLSIERKKEVLLHECLHAIDKIMNYGLNEKLVNAISVEILKLIVDNQLNFLV